MEKILNILLVITVGLLFLYIGCYFDPTDFEYEDTFQEGIIQEKNFEKGDVQVNTTLLNGMIYTNTTNTPDEYTVTINDKEYDVSKETWAELEQGQTIQYTISFGLLKNVTILED